MEKGLTSIGFYNPGRLTDIEIEASFIARKSLFKFILGKVKEQDGIDIPQHLLIIGQRGMGKTTLLLRIGAELRKEDLKEKFIAINYPEEQYNIDRLSKFWKNSLDGMADALEKEGKLAEAEELDKDIAQMIGSSPSLDPFTTFKKWKTKINRRPVLLVDNFSLVLSKLDKKEHHVLRSILIGEGTPIMIGASTTSMKETVEYGEPFYEAFSTQYLKKLTLKESIRVMLELSKIHNLPLLESHLNQHKGRLSTLYQLTGGTPRTISMLLPLVAQGFSEDINRDLESLLDLITPLYKSRFEQLPNQMQVVLDSIALHWDPISLEQLRDATALDNKKLSPQLKRLVDIGWIKKLSSTKSKGKLYEISERFFNVWYLMRRSSRRQRKAIYCLSKFLEVFYGEKLELVAEKRVNYNSKSKEDIMLNYALGKALSNHDLRQKLLQKTENDLEELSKFHLNIKEDFEFIKSEKQDEEVSSALLKVIELTTTNKTDEAIRDLVAIEASKKLSYSDCFVIGYLYEWSIKNPDKSALFYRKAIELNAEHAAPWNGLGNLYQYHLKEYDQSMKSYKRAIELNPKYTAPWNGLGNLYQCHIKDYDQSEESYKKAIELDPKFAYPWNGLGNLYQYHLKNYDQSKESYKKAIELDPKFAYPWNGLGNLYQDHLIDFDQSQESYNRAIKLTPIYAYPWNGLGKLYQYCLKDYIQSEKCYKRAIELDSKDPSPWNRLGNLYQDQLNDPNKAENCYQQAIDLGDNMAKYNLIFLFIKEQKDYSAVIHQIQKLSSKEQLTGTNNLINSYLSYNDRNYGKAKDYLLAALNTINDSLPNQTQDDWYRIAALIVRLDYKAGKHYVETIKESGYDVILRPYYEAIIGLMEKNANLYFNTIAAELRVPAREILDYMKKYLN